MSTPLSDSRAGEPPDPAPVICISHKDLGACICSFRWREFFPPSAFSRTLDGSFPFFTETLSYDSASQSYKCSEIFFSEDATERVEIEG